MLFKEQQAEKKEFFSRNVELSIRLKVLQLSRKQGKVISWQFFSELLNNYIWVHKKPDNIALIINDIMKINEKIINEYKEYLESKNKEIV